jgi:hypothetical protein
LQHPLLVMDKVNSGIRQMSCVFFTHNAHRARVMP